MFLTRNKTPGGVNRRIITLTALIISLIEREQVSTEEKKTALEIYK